MTGYKCLSWPCVLCHGAKFMVGPKKGFVQETEKRKEVEREENAKEGKEGRKEEIYK